MSNEKQEADARYFQGLSGTPGVEERLRGLEDGARITLENHEERLAKLEEWRKEYEPLMNWEDMAKKKTDSVLVEPTPDGGWVVVGGAGGKLNHLKIDRILGKEEYAAKRKEQAEKKDVELRSLPKEK